MNAAIVAKLGLDKSEFRRGLNEATNDAKQAGKDLKDESLLEGKNKAERNIVGLSEELLRANSAGDLLIGTLGRLPNIFNVSLLTGVAGGLAAALVKMGLDAKEAFEKARVAVDELSESLQKTIRFGGAGELDAAFSSIPKKIKELNAELAETGKLKDVAINSVSVLFGGASVYERQYAIISDISNLQQQQNNVGQARIQKEQMLVEIAEMRAKGLFKEADFAERQLKLTEELHAISKIYEGSIGDRLKALKTEQFVLGEQARTTKEIQDAKEKGFKEAAERAKKAQKDEEEFQKELERGVAEVEKERAAHAADRARAEKELAEVGESAQERQARLLKEYAELEQKAWEAQMTGQVNADELKAEMARKQQEIAEDALRLNKEILAEENKRAEAAARIAKQQEAAAQKRAQEKREKVQLTLGELAAEGKGQVGRDARRAEKEEDRARNRALRGDLEGAQRAQERADKIKRGIATLRDSEKDLGDAMKGALEGAQVLKDIKDNTANLGKML